jgi:hypothetical protein
LYERKELLRVEEEKSWKIQEAMMKYGKSGSSDEEGSGSGSDDNTEEEDLPSIADPESSKVTKAGREVVASGCSANPKGGRSTGYLK